MPRYTEDEAREAIAASITYSEALRRMGLRAAGGNHRVLKKWAERWGISTDHFDPDAARRPFIRREPIPLDEVLVEHSAYHRGKLKERLFRQGVKERRCELCGQDEIWHGRSMALILDHINGVFDDNRLENLQVVCRDALRPQAQAARRRTAVRPLRPAVPPPARSASVLLPGMRATQQGREDRPPDASPQGRPPAPRPAPREVAALGFCATGRRYGVSDNAIRTWLRAYEREARAPTMEP